MTSLLLHTPQVWWVDTTSQTAYKRWGLLHTLRYPLLKATTDVTRKGATISHKYFIN